MADAVLEIVALGRTPIREGSPAGDAVTYDSDFEAIKIEIAKLDAAAGIPPEYSKVVSLSTAILGSKSKDLTVVCYLAHALFFTRGYAGLRDGFDLCRETLANFWETLYPEMKRMRGRTGAIAWLNERAAAAIARKPAVAADLEGLTAAAESLAQLSAVVNEKFADDAPVLSEVRRALEDAKRVASELAAPRAAPPASAAAASPSASSAPAAPTAIDSPDAALRVLVNAGNDVKRAAVFLIQKDPASPVPYLVTRGIVWGMVRDLPPHTDGVTPFPAPDPNLANAWTGMADAGNWQALLVEAEQRLFGNPLWLDLNRYVARALEALGHSAAHRAVVDLTLALTRRLPGLVELSFQGGETPFASEETRAWLAAEARAAGAAAGEAALVTGATPAAAATDAEEGAFQAAVRDAKGLASRKKIVDAIKLIQERAQSAPSPRVRFRYRAALAAICLEAGQHAVASAQYDALLDDIERHALDEWEPDLSREVLEASYICEKRMSQNGQRNGTDSAARLGRLYARICRIDLLSALALERKK